MQKQASLLEAREKNKIKKQLFFFLKHSFQKVTVYYDLMAIASV